MAIKELRAAYNKAAENLRTCADAIEAADESADLDVLRTAFDEAEAEAERTKGNYEAAERAASAKGKFLAVDEPADERTPAVAVTKEEPTYHRGNSMERSFFADMFAADRGDSEARERMGRNAAENKIEKRAGATANFAGLTIPQYLVDLYAPYLRAGRPFANAVRKMPLPPEGMTLNISRLTTGTTNAIQASENDSVSSTDADDTLLTINVRTVAGQQDVSRQLLERATPGIDELLYQDLLSAYATTLDAGILTGSGNSGTHKGVLSAANVNTVTYTDASPTVAEIYPKFADAIQQINTNRFSGPTGIFMHPRRWGWFTAATDTTGRPFVVPFANAVMGQEAYNAPGVSSASGYTGPVGTLMGVPVFLDANIPVNTGYNSASDSIIVAKLDDCILWEEGDGTPRQARFEQTLGNQLTVKLVVYGYSAFTAERYANGVSIISGSGLVTPTF